MCKKIKNGKCLINCLVISKISSNLNECIVLYKGVYIILKGVIHVQANFSNIIEIFTEYIVAILEISKLFR